MNHLARCCYQRFLLASRHMRVRETGGWSSSLNHSSFERSVHVLEGLLHIEGYHIDDICEFARERRMNVFMRSDPPAGDPPLPRDLLVAFDFGRYRAQSGLRCLWVGAVRPDASRLKPLARYVCNIKMKMQAARGDLLAHQRVDEQLHAIRAEAAMPEAQIAVSHSSPLFVDEPRNMTGLQMNIFKRDKKLKELLEKLMS